MQTFEALTKLNKEKRFEINSSIDNFFNTSQLAIF